MGRVPKDQQVYNVSYYLDGKALNFYNQVVSKDEKNWDLKRFFTELFEFCFPVDFRNAQQKQLNRCFQNQKTVAAHVAEWSHIWNTIGLEDTQEKIVKLFNSFTYPVQTEITRKNLDPEVNSWDEIIIFANRPRFC
jgi:Mg2+/Co2+ transporter CorB